MESAALRRGGRDESAAIPRLADRAAILLAPVGSSAIGAAFIGGCVIAIPTVRKEWNRLESLHVRRRRGAARLSDGRRLECANARKRETAQASIAGAVPEGFWWAHQDSNLGPAD